MQIGFYFFVACLAAAGALLVRGRRNVFRLRLKNMLTPYRRLKSRVGSYSEKMKFREWLRKRREEKIDKEISESISFLRNIIALGSGRRVSSDYIIEQLSQKEGVMQPCYLTMLRFLRIGKLEDAVKVFSDEADTAIGSEFGALLLRWDSLDPLELIEILISYQKGIKEVKGTAQRKRDEMVSEFIYFPVVLNVFIIFINFIVVGYFMEQKEMLRMMF